MKNNNHNYIKWIRAAEDDLKLAKVILEEENFYPAICFHSQQSVEKSLKAFLLHQNFSEDLRTHFEVNIFVCSIIQVYGQLRTATITHT